MDNVRLATFRDSQGNAVTQWPKALWPSTTVIVVGAATEIHANVLVHRRADNHGWAFPGGRQEIGESIQTCALRECHEETGYHIALDCLLCVDSDPEQGAIVAYPDGLVHYTNLTFLAHVIGGNLCVSSESLEVCWRWTDKLPTPFLPSHQWRLQQFLTHYCHVPFR